MLEASYSPVPMVHFGQSYTLVSDLAMVTKPLVTGSIYAATEVRQEIIGIVLLACR